MGIQKKASCYKNKNPSEFAERESLMFDEYGCSLGSNMLQWVSFANFTMSSERRWRTLLMEGFRYELMTLHFNII